MNEFALLRQICGLTHPEAADYLGVRLDTVKSWNVGRNPVPAHVLVELSDLWADIESSVVTGIYDVELPAGSQRVVEAIVLARELASKLEGA